MMTIAQQYHAKKAWLHRSKPRSKIHARLEDEVKKLLWRQMRQELKKGKKS
jgi:hypothetical protein